MKRVCGGSCAGCGNVCVIRWEMVVCGVNGPWKIIFLVLSDIITIWTDWV